MAECLAIHFGGGQTRLAVLERNKPATLAISGVSSTIPTFIAFNTETEDFVIGEKAAAIRAVNPENVVWNLPGFLYPPKADDFLQSINNKIPVHFEVFSNNECVFTFDKKQYSIEELVRLFIKKIKQIAEEADGRVFDCAAITVPGCTTIRHRTAVIEGAKGAGFEKCRLITDPEAAVLAVCPGIEGESTICGVTVGFSYGGTVMLNGDGEVFETKEPLSHPYKGLWACDMKLADVMSKRLMEKYGNEYHAVQSNYDRLLTAAAEARNKSAVEFEFVITIPHFKLNDSKYESIDFIFTTDELKAVFDETINWFPEASRSMGEIGTYDRLLLSAEESLPSGALNRAVSDSFSLNPEKGYPAREGIVYGAAVLAGIKNGTYPELLIIQQLTAHIGLEAADNKFYQIIKAPFALPCKLREVFSTSADNQSEVALHLYEGLAETVTENTFIKSYTIGGIPPAPAGEPQIEVTLDFDSNGLLYVSAKEQNSGKELICT